MDENKAFLRKLFFLTAMKFFVGSTLLFFENVFLGAVVLLSSSISVAWILYVLYMNAQRKEINIALSSAYLHISIGAFILVIGVSFLVLNIIIFQTFIKIIIGSIITTKGVYHLHNIKR